MSKKPGFIKSDSYDPEQDDQRRGPLSSQEKNYIKTNAGNFLPEDIAKHLKRNPKSILKYLKDEGLTKYYKEEDLLGNDVKLDKLKKTPYWEQLSNQFSPSELKLFQYHWINVLKQFKDDILHTEELQILDMVKLEVLMNRVLNQETEIKNKIVALEEDLLLEKKLPTPDQDYEKIRQIEAQITSLYAGKDSIMRDYKDLLKEKQNLFKGLKATREQRIKQIEDSKETMAGWYRKLMTDQQLRYDLGIYMEKMRISTKVEYERLSELHTFADGKIDQPLLTPENII